MVVYIVYIVKSECGLCVWSTLCRVLYIVLPWWVVCSVQVFVYPVLCTVYIMCVQCDVCCVQLLVYMYIVQCAVCCVHCVVFAAAGQI